MTSLSDNTLYTSWCNWAHLKSSLLLNSCVRLHISILEILNVCLWLKYLSFLNLNKIELFKRPQIFSIFFRRAKIPCLLFSDSCFLIPVFWFLFSDFCRLTSVYHPFHPAPPRDSHERIVCNWLQLLDFLFYLANPPVADKNELL